VTGDLLAAYACRAAALAAMAGSVPLALNQQWLAFALLLWLVPSLLLVDRRARRAHARSPRQAHVQHLQTSTSTTRKDTTTA
jgi:uncharacterized membrane protein